jgi:hypothetical protein
LMKCLNAITDGEISSSRSRIGPDGLADAEVNKSPFPQGPDEYAVTADGGTTLFNHLDTRVSRSGRASEFNEVSVVGPDAQKQGPNAAYANPSLSKIRISVAYLKRLISCIFVRIQY